MSKLDILAIGVHPDDVELSCAGTLIHYQLLGKKIGLLDLTKGELGTRGNAHTRTSEAEASTKILGADVRVQLDMADGFFTHDKEHLLPIITVLREHQPEMVLINAKSDRHPDHGRAAKLCADACFLSGLIKIETWNDRHKIQDPWRPRMVFHYIQDYYLKPDFVFDITPYFDKKMEMILAFKSQFYDPNSAEPTSPISSKEFMDFIRSRAMDMGRSAGYELAEGFQIDKNFGVRDLFQLD